MASGCKSPKAELVAIYQLEFYRKQKNWKFCRKEKSKQTEDNKDDSLKPETKCLNQTYQVKQKDNKSVLNRAFLGPVHEDDSSQTDSPKKPKESQPNGSKKRNRKNNSKCSSECQYTTPRYKSEEDVSPQTDSPKKPKESQPNGCKKRNGKKNQKCSSDAIDTPKPRLHLCQLQRLQNERNTKESHKNFEPEKALKEIFQDSPNPFEFYTENADDNVKTSAKQLDPQTVTAAKDDWSEGTATYADDELDGSQRCIKRKKFIWALGSDELDIDRELEDVNYYYEVQAYKVMEQPLWFQELAKEAHHWSESDLNNVQPWPEADRNSDYVVRNSQESHNVDQTPKTEWTEPDAGHDSGTKGWQHSVKQTDTQDVQYINNWQQISQAFSHSPPRQETYHTDSKQQDMLKYQNHQDHRFVQNQSETRQNFDTVLQNFDEMPQTFDNFQKTPQNFENVTSQCYEIPPLFKNFLEAQKVPQAPLNSPQPWFPGEEPCPHSLPELDPVGCEGCEPRSPLEPSPWNYLKEADAIWSEDVLRELEALESSAPPAPPPVPPADGRAGCAGCAGSGRGGRWVRPERLLEWLLTKEPAPAHAGAGQGAASLDSSGSSGASADEFMRDAHCNPHSTELSLDLEPLLPACGLARRPTAALRARGAAHARALHALACEIRAREDIVRGKEMQRPRALADHPHVHQQSGETSSEEFPTCDLGLHASPDALLAGSHHNHPHTQLFTLHHISNDPGAVSNENGATCKQVNILFDKITAALKSQCNKGYNGQKDLNEAGNHKGVERVAPANQVDWNQEGVNCSESGATCNSNLYVSNYNTRDFKVKEINNNEIQLEYFDTSNPGYNKKTVYNRNGANDNRSIVARRSNATWGTFTEREGHGTERGVNLNEGGVNRNECGVRVDDVTEMSCSIGRGRGRLGKESSLGGGRGRGAGRG